MSSEKHLTSPQNPSYKRWLSLHSSRGIKKHQQCLISGAKILKEMLQQKTLPIGEVLIPENFSEDLSSWGLDSSTQIYRLPKDLFRNLDEYGTASPLGVGQLTESPEKDLQKPPEGLELLVSLGDPSNLGAVLRSAEAFQAFSVVLLKESAHPFHPKAIRASSGSCFRLPLFRGPEITSLPENLVVLDTDGVDLVGFSWPKNVRLLIGEEGPGTPTKNHFSHRVKIPMSSSIESLNGATAAAIALFHYRHMSPS